MLSYALLNNFKLWMFCGGDYDFLRLEFQVKASVCVQLSMLRRVSN